MNHPEFEGHYQFRRSGGTDDELKNAGTVVHDYVLSVATNVDKPQTQSQALQESKYLELPLHSKNLIGMATATVMLAAYHHGFRELMSGEAFPRQELHDIIDVVSEGYSKWDRIKRYLGAIYCIIRNR